MSLKINRFAIGILVILTLVALLFINIFLLNKNIDTDTVKVDEIINKVESNKNSLNEFTFHNGYDFIVTDFEGGILFSTNAVQAMSIAQRKNEAIKNNILIMDFSEGYIFIDTSLSKRLDSVFQNLRLILSLFIVVLMFAFFAYYLYLYLRLIKPFAKMKGFAQNIAAGNFDMPIIRSRYNYFGAFTESFDIMREELKKAEIRANEAEKSKKELVAQLSHDIKTPLASIKAVLEVMSVQTSNQKSAKSFEHLTAKTNEIDRLISDLFAHTLEELTELKVNCIDIESKILQEIIIQSDLDEKIKFLNSIPECMVHIDGLRLRQVFDNIISNSYKYANTDIEVSFLLEERLIITVCDFGDGVKEEELPLLANKFYRGSNAVGKAGSGLGLNIVSNFMAKMGGAIEFTNVKGGFEVKIYLKLS